MKKFTSLFLALIMVFAVGTLIGCDKGNGSSSGDGASSKRLEYELVKQTQEDGGNYYKVVKLNLTSSETKKINNGNYSDIMIDLEIPETYNDVKVTKIDSEAFLNQKIIKSVTIPSSITEIGAGAFDGCINLEKITLPFIGEKLDAVNEKKVFGYIFGDATADGLTEAKQRYNANEETTKSYYIPTSLKTVVFTGSTLSEYAFNGCTTLTDVVLNEKVSIIPRSAFADCTGIKKFVLTENVGTIAPYAFEGCTGLLKVTFNDILATIGDNAFEGCTNLNLEVDLVLPSTLRTLGSRAFKGCTVIKSIDLSKIESSGFTVKENTFSGCVSLEKVIFANGQVVEDLAFSNCVKLTAEGITNLSGIEYGDMAFSFQYLG